MNPKTIADAYRDGKTGANVALGYFVVCAMDNSIENIVREIPETLRDEFKTFIAILPEADEHAVPGPTLKKEWILGFKSYYKNHPS